MDGTGVSAPVEQHITPESPRAAVPLDTGLVCLVMLARFHQVAVEPAQLAHEFGQAGVALGPQELLLAAKKLGLKARSVLSSIDRINKTPLPAIAAELDGGFFILAKAEGGNVLIQSPREQLTQAESNRRYMPKGESSRRRSQRWW